ncbi:MAG: hypothetical protein V3V18_01755 [Methylococcales bacterium]
MSLQKQIFLLSKKPGLLRFQLPADLSNTQVAEIVVSQLLEIDGVSQVRSNARKKHLTILYDDTVYSFIDLARSFHEIIGSRVTQEAVNSSFTTTSQANSITKQGIVSNKSEFNPASQLVNWVRDKVNEVRETIIAAGVLIRAVLTKPTAFIKDPEKAIIDFCNDVLVLYLIKIHWHRITQHWIQQPWRYRFEWLAVFYLVFLLVRSRMSPKEIDHDE